MMKKGFLVFLLGSVLTLGAACTPNEENTSTSTIDSAHVTDGAHFDYEDQSDWQFISGEMQSPIDIQTENVEEMVEDTGTIELNYDINIQKVENNGHSIQVTDVGSAVINGRHFSLAQFHFHAQSEHTINGEYYPMETHFVHFAQDGRIAVIGVFFEEGRENAGFQEVLNNLASETINPIMNLMTLLPENKSYYHYLGSLTTPPLTENVEWYLMKTPVEISSEQLTTFCEFYDHNNREIQPLNERTILEYNE